MDILSAKLPVVLVCRFTACINRLRLSRPTEQRVGELLEAKSEILRLRAQLRRTEEERDILKKPRGTLPGNPSRYRFINEHWQEYRVTILCWVLQVARSGFY